MGLDITAYRSINRLDAVYDEDGEPIDPTTREPLDYAFKAYINSDFPGRADELVNHAVYNAEDSVHLHAGSYGGYNAWREWLAQMAGYALGKYEQYGGIRESYCVPCWNGATGPFSELINFSDCEGVIGCAVSTKLAADFAEFQAKADASDKDLFRAKYAEWRSAFELAANNGAVQFH